MARSIYKYLSVGDYFDSGVDTYYVRHKAQGHLYLQDVTNTNTDPVTESSVHVTKHNPADSIFSDKIAEILDLSNRNFTRCETCVAGGVVDPENLCDGCKDNRLTILYLKNALS